jgi:hypothetical protein
MLHSALNIRLIDTMIDRQHRFVGVGFREAQHVYIPGLVLAWHLSLY